MELAQCRSIRQVRDRHAQQTRRTLPPGLLRDAAGQLSSRRTNLPDAQQQGRPEGRSAAAAGSLSGRQARQDFAEIRAAQFPGDERRLLDFRRSGSIEAYAGDVDRKALAKKVANTIAKSPALQKTNIPPGVLPPNADVVRLADAARVCGRARMRGLSPKSTGERTGNLESKQTAFRSRITPGKNELTY
jgi:hypothetical protein